VFSARTASRLVLAVALAATASLLVAAASRADADPASDVLYSQKVFYSYDQLPSDAAQKRLNDVVASATKAGYPIRVALIANPADLGGVTALWGKPHQYARFLSLELGFVYKGSLVVVMPAGLGYARNGKSSTSADALLRPVRLESGNDAQANAAVTAIAKLARASGHTIDVPPQTADGSGGGGGSTWRNRLIILLAALVLAQLVAAGLVWRRRAARPN
jgi:hypothetical protein